MSDACDFNSSLNWFYTLFFCICLTYDALILFRMMYLLIKEFRQCYIDVFKFIQYLLLFIYFLRDVPNNLRYFWCFKYNLTFSVIDDVLRTNFFAYCFNQLSYYALIIHLAKIRKIIIKPNFEELRKEIRSGEVKSLIYAMIFCLFVITTRILCDLFLEYYSDDIIIRIQYAKSAGFFLMLIIIELYLFWMLKRLMKSTLHQHYKESWKRLKYLLMFNMVYFCLLFCIDISISLFVVDYDSMFGYSSEYSYEDWQRILLVLAQLSASTCLFLYAFFNTMSIKFKDWIFDTMSGYKILNHYYNASMFIKRNRCFSNKTNKEDSLINSEEDGSSILSKSGRVDYDESDDYMKNFKLNYVSSDRSTSTDKKSLS